MDIKLRIMKWGNHDKKYSLNLDLATILWGSDDFFCIFPTKIFCSVKDVRPGLVFKQSTKRQFQIEEQHRSANEKMRKLNKPVRVLEAEKREEGLSTAISSQNKGTGIN